MESNEEERQERRLRELAEERVGHGLAVKKREAIEGEIERRVEVKHVT